MIRNAFAFFRIAGREGGLRKELCYALDTDKIGRKDWFFRVDFADSVSVSI